MLDEFLSRSRAAILSNKWIGWKTNEKLLEMAQTHSKHTRRIGGLCLRNFFMQDTVKIIVFFEDN